MGRIPVRFKRVAAAFDEVARVRLCESSGSEHSPESSTDLSNLVNSFIERGEAWWGGDVDGEIEGEEEHKNEGSDFDSLSGESEKKDMLKNLLGKNDDDDVKRKIYAEVESAYEMGGDTKFQGFKRRLMTYLREKGFDAGRFIYLFASNFKLCYMN